jgi:hypothetical protein
MDGVLHDDAAGAASLLLFEIFRRLLHSNRFDGRFGGYGVPGIGVELCMVGIVLYPPCSVPLVPGLPLLIDRGLPSGGVP